MLEKITLEHFQEIISKISNLYNSIFDDLINGKVTEEELGEEGFLNLVNEYANATYPLLQELTSYDLSDIPTDAYQEIFVCIPEDKKISFNGTNANIDFYNVNCIITGNNLDFNNCNVTNFRIFQHLDGSFCSVEETKEILGSKYIENNPQIFLDDSFTPEFREKYMLSLCTIDDIAVLSPEQLSKLPKDRKYAEYKLYKLISTIGLENVLKAYNLDKNFYAILLDNADCLDEEIMTDFDKDKIMEHISENIGDRYFQFRRNYGPETKAAFPKYFIENYTSDQELIEHFYTSKLTFEDLISHPEVFSEFDYSDAISLSIPNRFEEINKALGYKKLYELYNKYPKLMKAMFDSENAPKIFKIGDFIYPNAFESQLREAVRQYMINNYFTSVPEEFSEMFDKIIIEQPDLSDFENYERVIIKDYDSLEVINKLGAANLYQLSCQTNMTQLLKKEYGYDFMEFLINWSKSNRIPFFQPPSYDDFIYWIGQLYLDNQYCFEGEPDFSKIAPDLFVPKELGRIKDLTLPIISSLTDEERQYLCTHDISYRFSDNRWFVKEYCSKFGNEHLLDFLNENTLFFSRLYIYEGDIDFDKSEKEVIDQFYDLVYQKYKSNEFQNEMLIFQSEEMTKRYSEFNFSDFEEEIQYKLTTGNLTAELVKQNPEIVEQLKEKNYKKMTSAYASGRIPEDIFYELAPIYGKFLVNNLYDYSLDAIKEQAYKMVLLGEIYDESYKEAFKDHPEMFCPDAVPEDLKQAFYEKTIVYTDDNIKYFDGVNIALGNRDMLFMAQLKLEEKSEQENNRRRYLIYQQYKKIRDDDEDSKYEFQKFIAEHYEELTEERISILGELFNRISNTNSSELYRIRTELERQLLYVSDPLEKFDTIEKVFASNHIPNFTKRFLVYKTINPDMVIREDMSPVLYKYKDHPEIKDAIIFADLIRINLESANTDLVRYLDNIEDGERLYRDIMYNQLQGPLSLEQIQLLKQFSGCLKALYNYSKLPNKDEFVEVSDPIENIKNLSNFLKVDSSQSIADRIIRMYCYFAGVESIEDARKIITPALENITNRNKNRTDFSIHTGDFIKGIGDVEYLGRILDNGSVAREFLGCNADSDATPLDTDCVIVTSEEGSFDDKIVGTQAPNFGPIYFVIKGDAFFQSRDNDGNLNNLPSRIRDALKGFESFKTGNDKNHFGIRSGFPISYVDHIVVGTYNQQIGFELARKGVYIPVVDKEGKLCFTYDDYEKLRAKMQGLSYLGCSEYKLSNNLETPEIIEIKDTLSSNASNVESTRNIINALIEKICRECGIPELRTYLSKDITIGFAEFIDTGSTGRGTNKPNDCDYDFMMRLDNSIFKNSSSLLKLKEAIKKEMLKNGGTLEETTKGSLRFSDVKLDGLKDTVMIDISFAPKTDDIEYTTDICLKDRLESIREQYGVDKYKLVLANIIMAKKIFKDAHCYKGHNSRPAEGGLGGVGIENWILQNGGSFYDACLSFMKVAEQYPDFENFKKNYHIWDFGENFEKGIGKNHDEFVFCKMDKDGFERMKEAIAKYLAKVKSNYEVETMLAEDETKLENSDSRVL